MKWTLKYYTRFGILFVSVIGTLSHFFYEWSGQNPAIGLLTPINESVWEHMKLLFFPMLFFSLFAIYKLKSRYPCAPAAFSGAILLGSLLIPAIFYFYTGILGYNLFLLDTATFYISVILAFLLARRFTQNCTLQTLVKPLILLTAVTCILFFLFTFFPPDLALFQSFA